MFCRQKKKRERNLGEVKHHITNQRQSHDQKLRFLALGLYFAVIPLVVLWANVFLAIPCTNIIFSSWTGDTLYSFLFVSLYVAIFGSHHLL